MLYTVRPLECIYQTKDTIVQQADEGCVFEIEGGHIFTRKQDENYIIEHISSTNMADYLNVEYQPGTVYK